MRSLRPVLGAALALVSIQARFVEAKPAVGDEHSALAISRPTDGGSAIKAERAFAEDARKSGQWTAFKKWAAADATMFVPQPVLARDWLKARADPARSVEWSPTASFVSCDGRIAINTGEWRRADGSVGYFTTVREKQADGGWRWMLDHGDTLAVPRARVARPLVRRASCSGRPTRPVSVFLQYHWAGLQSGGRFATNPTLAYTYHVESKFNRQFQAALWTGERWEQIVSDAVAAPDP